MASSLGGLIPELRPWAHALVLAAGRAGLQPRITSTRRSHAEQTRLYRRYLAGLQPYPVARPGTSAHEYGYAFDMVTSPLGSLGAVGELWESWGGIWGGHPRRRGSGYDPVHFEFPGFRLGTLPDLRQQQDERDTLLGSTTLREIFGPREQTPLEIIGHATRAVSAVPLGGTGVTLLEYLAGKFLP